MFLLKYFLLIFISLFFFSCNNDDSNIIIDFETGPIVDYKNDAFITSDNYYYKHKEGGYTPIHNLPLKKYDGKLFIDQLNHFSFKEERIEVDDVKDFYYFSFNTEGGFARVYFLNMIDGSVLSWGNNMYGSLGVEGVFTDDNACNDGFSCDDSYSNNLRTVTTMKDIKTIKALRYSYSFMAISESNEVYFWGINNEAQFPINKSLSDYGCNTEYYCFSSYETIPIKAAQISDLEEIISFKTDGIFYKSTDRKYKFLNTVTNEKSIIFENVKDAVSFGSNSLVLTDDASLFKVNHDDLSTSLLLLDVKDFNMADYTPMAITNDNQLRFINFDFSCTRTNPFYACIKLDEEKIVDNISGFIKIYENNVEKLSSNFFLQNDNKIVDVPYFLDMQETVVIGELGDYKKIFHNFKEDQMNSYDIYVVLMNDGTLKGWGYRDPYSILGANNYRVELPITLDYLGNTTTNIAFVSLHGRLGLFLIDSDGVRAVGDNNYDQFGLGKDAIDYSCESFPCDRAKEESPIDVNIK